MCCHATFPKSSGFQRRFMHKQRLKVCQEKRRVICIPSAVCYPGPERPPSCRSSLFRCSSTPGSVVDLRSSSCSAEALRSLVYSHQLCRSRKTTKTCRMLAPQSQDWLTLLKGKSGLELFVNVCFLYPASAEASSSFLLMFTPCSSS